MVPKSAKNRYQVIIITPTLPCLSRPNKNKQNPDIYLQTENGLLRYLFQLVDLR